MHLITCRYKNSERVGELADEGVTLFPSAPDGPNSMLGLIAAGPEFWSGLAKLLSHPGATPVSLSDVELMAPIPVPSKNIICLGWNYADHAKEGMAVRGSEAELPQHPVVFTKNVTSVNAPQGDIACDPQVTTQLDWEVELGVVIGIGGRKISPGDALRHVFGYTVINDISARDLQFRHKQFFLGKSLDGTCPMGPVIVSADEIPDPQVLNLSSWVNGQLKQSSNTRHQVFSVATTISILSQGMRLEPGDIIATGTPSGVGFARKPPEFLRPGDVVECEVEGIGRLRNRIVSG